MKPIPGFPDYFASEDGNIWSMKPHNKNSKRPNKPRRLAIVIPNRKDGANYRMVTLYGKGIKKKPRKVCLIILSAFVGPKPKGKVCCHGPNGSLNDSIGNLRWDTQANNLRDRKRDGTDNAGERNGRSILNSLQVRVIRRCYQNRFQFKNMTDKLIQLELAKTFRVGHSCIKQVVYHQNWKHIT